MRLIVRSVIFAVVIVGIAASCSNAEEIGSAPESALQFFPDDTDNMLFVDVAALRENPLVIDWVREQSRNRIPDSFDGFSDRTGLNLRTDVEEVAVGTPGPDELLVVARADYDPERVASYFNEGEIPAETYGGRRVYQPDSVQNWKVSFVDGYVLMGPDNSIRGAIDRVERPGSTALNNPDLVEGLRSLGEGYHVWAAGRPNPAQLPGGLETPQMVTDVLNSLEGGTYRMRLDEVVTGRAVGEFATPEVALRTSNLFQGLLTLARIQAFRFPGLEEVLDGLRVEAIEATVHVNFAVDADALRRLGGSGIGVGN